MGVQAREIRLKSRPEGLPTAANFDLVTVELPAPGSGEVLVRNLWMSVDPYMRGRMYDRPSYVPPFALGEAMQGGAVGRVEASNDPSLAPGDLVESNFGWREGFVASAANLQKLPQDGLPTQAYLGVLGMPGMTAYTGFHRLGEPKAGETVFVSGAGGAVGSTVCQIAKIRGCTVIGSAGSDAKLEWLKQHGVDAVINYKTCGNFLQALRAAAPSGIDIYFDNVGGEQLEAAMEVARPWARFVECGMIAQYNAAAPAPGPRNMMYIVGKRLRLQGFIVFDFNDMREQFRADMTQWVKEGRVQSQETVENGIENAPAAFLKLFSGDNAGKMLVKLG
ncbi:MAG TPA: NADP-dependent oxidoreductase [Caulobacterales bacterium]|nr:NADP-dependent oxidoreductase [Caulobacterales bacterium]